jgi:hypothetical protein
MHCAMLSLKHWYHSLVFNLFYCRSLTYQQLILQNCNITGNSYVYKVITQIRTKHVNTDIVVVTDLKVVLTVKHFRCLRGFVRVYSYQTI